MIAYGEEMHDSYQNVPLGKMAPAPILSNHTGYLSPGSENWEHDNTGSAQNYSGCYDDMMNAIAEHEGWQEGYDY